MSIKTWNFDGLFKDEFMTTKRRMDNSVTSMGFDSKSKKHKKADAKVMGLINEFAGLNPGIPPKSSFRSFLYRVLPPEIRRLRKEKIAREQAS